MDVDPRLRPAQQFQSPLSVEGDDGGGGGGGEAGGNGADAKKLRACEACRGLKVRCEPDAEDEDAPCKRCRKAGRSCVVTVPTRKRQKKTDSRVSELEKKIDALTASLQARVAGGPGPHGQEAPQQQQQQHQESPPTTSAARGGGGGDQAPPSTAAAAAAAAAGGGGGGAGHKRKASSTVAEDDAYRLRSRSAEERGDVVEQGLITMEDAAALLDTYRERMVQHLPAVVFPAGMTAGELRRGRPTLFLAIMAAAAGERHALQRVLQRELMHAFAEKLFFTGEKSVELVQALQIAVIWYWPPEHFEELKFYQLIHMAAVMAIDIGLGKKAAARGPAPAFRRKQPPDPMSLESRRAWLTCFFLALNTSMALRRPNLVRWSSFMAESLEVLATSPDAAPTDKYFCHLVWSHRLSDEVGGRFSVDDAPSSVNIADARTQYALRALERDLDTYVASVPRELMRPTLRISFSVVNLYMHEMALHTDKSSAGVGGPASPFETANLKENSLVGTEPLSAAHVAALSACLASIDGIFDAFLSMDVPAIRCLPVFNFMRVAYGVVILIKMYMSASNPDSDMGKVISRRSMRVEHYLETLIDKFRAAAADDKCRPASKFLVVLVMLRTWFYKQNIPPEPKNHTTISAAAAAPASSSSSPSPALRLLSEVAAADPRPPLYTPRPPFFSMPMEMPTPGVGVPLHPQTSPELVAGYSPWGQPVELDMSGMHGFDSTQLGLMAPEFQTLYDGSVSVFLNDPWVLTDLHIPP